ncbi:adhesin [Rossellomorea aquimaris]|uniref:adhesin n=1 Tax=Rossellomorea TaxID=2837508 RepID=UPI001CD378F4|nr:adhesin [Rossellomorea aquimaris]MCA1060470.1 adhesin [Rossellomorea aquimaris]
MNITDQAKQVLSEVLREQGAEGIRLSSVAGCCGPQISVSMDDPEPTDHIESINGIRVAIDSSMQGTEALTIDVETTPQGEGLVLIGANQCC